MTAPHELTTHKHPVGVVAFTGHMMDRVGRVRPHHVPRFPKEKEADVICGIRDALDRLDAGIGYCSATCGGDIIFIEEMLRRGGEVHVVLPYGEALFVNDALQVPGEFAEEQRFQANEGRDWLPRWQGVRDSLASRIVLGEKRAQDNTMASDCCNRVFLGLGLLKAEALSAPLTLLALWDGWSGDAPGGTRSLVKLAGSLGAKVEHLPHLIPADVMDIVRSSTPPPGVGSQPPRPEVWHEPPQQICAILFADVMRFSTLDETKLPSFITGYLQPLAGLIQVSRHGGYGPLDFNTWGDGLFCTFDSMHKATTFALQLQRLTASGEWKLGGGDEDTLKLRIALHAGPVYRIADPLFPKETYMGANVSLAARIEPVTPPGEVYCSEAFAALCAAEGMRGCRFEPVGKHELPKSAGTHALYAVRQR